MRTSLRSRALRILCASCVALLPAAALRGEEPKVVARLDPDVLGLDEGTILTIEVATTGFASLHPKPAFELENLEIVAGPSRAENFRFVNGETARSVSFQWQLRPRGLGAAKIKSIVVDLGETQRRLADLEARVEQQAPPGRAAARPTEPTDPIDPFSQLFPELFPRRPARQVPATAPKLRLQAVLDPPSPYVGQQAVYTLYLLTQADMHSMSLRDLPEFRGFWVRDIKVSDRPRPEWVELAGERYGRLTLLRRALYPLAPGRFEIPPATVDTVVEVPGFTPWGTPMSRPGEVRRTTEKLSVEVRALPAAPAGFAGAVGTFAAQARLEPASVVAGEAATLTLTVTGNGNLRGLPDPEPQVPAGLRRFPPQSQINDESDGGRLRTVRIWSYVLVPEQAGSFVVPPLTFAYFDPRTGEFRSAASGALSLSARPRPAEPTTVAATPVATAQASDAKGSTPGGPPSWLSAVLWAGGGALGALALVGALAAHRHARSPRARSRAELLARLEAVRSESRPRAAAGAIEDAWRDYLAGRWHLPAGTPIAEWGERLASQGVDRDVADRLLAFLNDLHLLRFAPELAATDALAGDLVDRSRRLARELH